MRITELIAKLEELLERVGNALVEVRNPAGDFDEAETVRPEVQRNGEKWRIFIDA